MLYSRSCCCVSVNRIVTRCIGDLNLVLLIHFRFISLSGHSPNATSTVDLDSPKEMQLPNVNVKGKYPKCTKFNDKNLLSNISHEASKNEGTSSTLHKTCDRHPCSACAPFFEQHAYSPLDVCTVIFEYMQFMQMQEFWFIRERILPRVKCIWVFGSFTIHMEEIEAQILYTC